MRGAIIFALATLVVPTLTAAVPLIDPSSLNVEPDVKRHTEPLNADQAKRTAGTERLPIVQRLDLTERGRSVFPGGDSKRRSQEAAEELIEPRGRVRWRDNEGGVKSSEGLVQRPGRVHWRGDEGGVASSEGLVQ